MRLLAITLLVALATIGLTGCAGNPINYAQRHADAGDYSGDPSRSQALNVAVATGLTECKNGQCAPLSDVPRSKLPESLQGVSNAHIVASLSDAWSLGSAVGHFTGVATALPGLSDFGSGLFMLGSFLLGPSAMDDPATKPTIIAWMPKEMAPNPKAASDMMAKIVYAALPRGKAQGYGLKIERYRQLGVVASFIRIPACSMQTPCSIDFSSFYQPAVVKQRPGWMRSGQAYAWTNWSRGQTADAPIHSIRFEIYHVDVDTHVDLPWPGDLNARAYLAKLSANLPAWVYIYLPPTDVHNYPVILNQGKPLLFIEPLGGVETASEQALP